MENRQELIYSFKAALRIVENTLSGKEVPFKVVQLKEEGKYGPYAIVDIENERFYVSPDMSGNKIWVVGFPIENTSDTGLDSGFAGFPTEVAGAIDRYYAEKPRGPFQNLTGIGTISLNEIIKEEIRKVFESDYDYAAQEREYTDRQYYQEDEAMREAEISAALSFIQDVQGSANKLIDQNQLKGTNPEVDKHLSEAIGHLHDAIEKYFDTLSPEIKDGVSRRIGEIKIK